MKKNDSKYRSLLSFFSKIDRTYRYKQKRLKFMQLASVDREIYKLRKSFDDLWTLDRGFYSLREPHISERGLKILTGLFGFQDEAQAIIETDKKIISMDRELFLKFMNEGISSQTAITNLFDIFFGSGESISSLISGQIPYMEKCIPTFRTIDEKLIPGLILEKEDLDNIRDIIEDFPKIKKNLSSDILLYKQFIRDFRNLYREKANLDIVGYGEISTVMQLKKGKRFNGSDAIDEPRSSPWIWKKMPPFPTIGEVLDFDRLYHEYRKILTNSIGISVPEQTVKYFKHEKYYIIYAGQQRVDTKLICNCLIRELDIDGAGMLYKKILEKLLDVYSFNQSGHTTIGFDGQLSNWVLVPLDTGPGQVKEGDGLIYLDTSTPLIRIEGREQLNAELFIKNAPSFLRFSIRKFFLQQVLDRYYDIRSVIIDLVANLHKEKRPDLIDNFIDISNRFLSANSIGDPLTRVEIESYYSNDVFIWRLFLAARRIDKFIVEKILRKKYTYRLPGKIDR